MKKGGLGKGLSALIPEKRAKEARGETEVVQLEVAQLKPHRHQPRETFDPIRLEELKASIETKGLIQPVLVRATDGGYELICGERRVRAARELGMETIPAVVRQVNDSEALELSLIENLQREDLNPIEEATAYQRLIEEFGLGQDELAEILGRDRSSISNTLRLLKLPKPVQDRISQGEISPGHAMAILSLRSAAMQVKLCERIIAKGLSVRATEQLVKAKTPSKRAARFDPEIIAFQEELQRILGTKVRIRPGRRGGRIEIEYYSDEDLERILEALKKSI